MKYMFWWECFECFFCKNMFCPHWKYEQRFAFSSLGKSDQSSVHVHDWISFKKVTKVPLMNVNWTWIEWKKFSSYNALIKMLNISLVIMDWYPLISLVSAKIAVFLHHKWHFFGYFYSLCVCYKLWLAELMKRLNLRIPSCWHISCVWK